MCKRLNIVLFFVFLSNYTNNSLAKIKPHTKAQQILDHIEIPNTLQADFIYIYIEKEAETPQEVQGKIWIKNNKYRIVLDDRIIISNGETIWNYLIELHEVQINTCEAEETTELFSPVQLLHMYEQGFVPISLAQKTIEKVNYDLVDLIPIDQQNAITHLTLMIDKKSHQIKNIKALDNNGTVHSFMIQTLVKDIEVEDICFEFDTTNDEELEIVDLR
jgi:outer membrane lipoprotein-sorting protein